MEGNPINTAIGQNIYKATVAIGLSPELFPALQNGDFELPRGIIAGLIGLTLPYAIRELGRLALAGGWKNYRQETEERNFLYRTLPFTDRLKDDLLIHLAGIVSAVTGAISSL